jgi:peptidoglycan/xylan/chitin deacetylase (PgdA/CDA1 family)
MIPPPLFRHAAFGHLALVLLAVSFPSGSQAELIRRLPTTDRVVALTFDACEQIAPKRLDHRISDYLVAHKIPFTVFMTGTFARDNAADVRTLSELNFVEVENHSWSHPNHMTRLPDGGVRRQVELADREIVSLADRHPAFFRFPAGRYNARVLHDVETLGYRAIQWRWAVGDPDPRIDADAIVRRVLERTRPGDIIIMHINGRGVHTAEALPRVIEGLSKEGFRFVTLATYLSANAQHDPRRL